MRIINYPSNFASLPQVQFSTELKNSLNDSIQGKIKASCGEALAKLKDKSTGKPVTLWDFVREDKFSTHLDKMTQYINTHYKGKFYTLKSADRVNVEKLVKGAENFAAGKQCTKADAIAAFSNVNFVSRLKSFCAAKGIDRLLGLTEVEWTAVASQALQNLKGYNSNWLLPFEIDNLLFKALANAREIPLEKFTAVVNVLSACQELIAQEHNALCKNLEEKYGQKIASLVPSLNELLDLLLPIFMVEALYEENITEEYAEGNIGEIFKNWHVHFLLALMGENSLSEEEINRDSLGMGMCAGIACDHVMKRLKDPDAPLSAKDATAIPIVPNEGPFPDANLYQLNIKGNITPQMRFLHAANAVEGVRPIKGKETQPLPSIIANKMGIAFPGHLLPASPQKTSKLFSLTTLVFTLHKHAKNLADKKGQAMICIGDNQHRYESHALSVQFSSPMHLMDPTYMGKGYGILECATSKALFRHIPLYLKTRYKHYNAVVALEVASSP